MKFSFLKNTIMSGAVIGMLLSATPVFAQSGLTLFPCDGPNCSFGDVIEVAQAVASRVVEFGFILAPFVFAFVGYLFLTSQDNPAKRIRARKIGINVAIGLVIMLIAWVVVNLILTALVSQTILSNPA